MKKIDPVTFKSWRLLNRDKLLFLIMVQPETSESAKQVRNTRNAKSLEIGCLTTVIGAIRWFYQCNQ